MINEVRMLALSKELARVKNAQNIAAALAIYHPDIELSSPGFESVSCGTAAVENSLNLFFSLFPDYRVSLNNYAFNGPMMLATGEVSLTPRLPGHSCPQITMPVFLELHFKAGRISKEIFFLDLGLLCKKARISPEQLAAAIMTAHASIQIKEPTVC